MNIDKRGFVVVKPYQGFDPATLLRQAKAAVGTQLIIDPQHSPRRCRFIHP